MPRTAVALPIAKTPMLHHHTGGPSRSNAMRTNPYTATLVITPLISAETWLRAAGRGGGSQKRRARMAERNQDIERHQPALGPAAERHEQKAQRTNPRRWRGRADGIKGIAA